MSNSEKARVAALPHLVTYIFGLIPLAGAPILASNPIYFPSTGFCYFASFFTQKIVWNLIANFDILSMRSKITTRTNLPFIITRLRNWTQLQLGACVLGLMTSDIQIQDSEFDQYASLISSYFFLAFLDMFSYASEPQIFHHHALIQGGFRAFIWMEGFHLLGTSVLGIAAGAAILFPEPRHQLPGESAYCMATGCERDCSRVLCAGAKPESRREACHSD